MVVTSATTWNHNTHFHDWLLARVPSSAERALDIGCGDGQFAWRLADRCREVVAIDVDEGQVTAARVRCQERPNVTVQHADFLHAPLPEADFDLITILATLHHMEFDKAAERLHRVLAPGGTLVVLGVWTDARSITDFGWNVASTITNWWLRRRRGSDSMTAPATPPRMSFEEVRVEAATRFPGATISRHLLWRYTLVWQKPTVA